jgi:serine/threonine protein kinase
LPWRCWACSEYSAFALTPPIIHRDIKPANIIRDTENGKLFLVDFGLARGTSEHTQTTAGTLMFCPPEQMLGKADVRSDLYALGATLYLLLTGQPIQMGRYMPVLAHRDPTSNRSWPKPSTKFSNSIPTSAFRTAAEMREFLTRPYVVAAGPNPWPKRAGYGRNGAAGAWALIGIRPLMQSLHPATPSPTPVATETATPVAVGSPTLAADGLPAVPIQHTHVSAKPTWFLREKVFRLGDLDTAMTRMAAQIQDYTRAGGLNTTGYLRWHLLTTSEADLEVGVILPRKMASPGGQIEAGSLPEGEAITLTHKGGDYPNLKLRYEELQHWAVDQHLQVDPAPWGIYRVTYPEPDPQKWETDLYYLIKP